MAVDIFNAVSGELGITEINNGSITVGLPGRGAKARVAQYYDDGMVTKPVIADIEDKYDARFDEPRYYTGDSATDS